VPRPVLAAADSNALGQAARELAKLQRRELRWLTSSKMDGCGPGRRRAERRFNHAVASPAEGAASGERRAGTRAIKSRVIVARGGESINAKHEIGVPHSWRCFWCIEAVFERLRSYSVVSGYTGGKRSESDLRRRVRRRHRPRRGDRDR
jgi:hypothetical protein